jgi:hypothetical protein
VVTAAAANPGAPERGHVHFDRMGHPPGNTPRNRCSAEKIALKVWQKDVFEGFPPLRG